MSSFFELGLDRHLGRSDHLSKIDTLLDWGRLSSLLSGDRPSRGRTGYDPVQLLKCLLLQSWHGLSDPGLEQSLRVRLDFLRFTGFGLGESLPDETTLCRFRNKLVKRGAYSAVLREVNRQLESHGLKVKQAEAANKEMLKSRGLKNGLMYKAWRNRPTTQRMKAFNKPVSRTRWRIEQCFGTIKRRFRMTRASYFTRDKVDAQFAMKAIGLNLLKAVNKVILT